MAEKTQSIAEIVKGSYGFSNRLYLELAKEEGNIMFSTLSVHTILSLLHQGANGATEKDLRACLRLPGKAKSAEEFASIMNELRNVRKVVFLMANKIYVNKIFSLRNDFVNLARSLYSTEVENMNFTRNKDAAHTINKWIEQQTRGAIRHLMDPEMIEPDTGMILVNAIYFKGEWEKGIDTNKTKLEKFHVNKKESVDCHMMHTTTVLRYKLDKKLNAKVLRMNYRNDDYSMVFVLPNKDGFEGWKMSFESLENRLRNYDLTKLREDMDLYEISLSLPRFKIESDMMLDEPLNKMGLKNIYSDIADFGDMLNRLDVPLMVKTIVQKTFLEVNEEGGEAASTTAVHMYIRSAHTFTCPKADFNADRPFRFYLFVKDYLLFSGKLIRPEA